MPIYLQQTRFASNSSYTNSKPGFLRKVVTFAIGAGFLVLAFTLSVFMLAFVATAGLLSLGYVWWKTRDLRRQMREQSRKEYVIEGEVIQDDRSHDRIQR
jgi:O-antigen/teichoic acid export membrane protein